eukprot:scaffold261474_cov28-Tisochrysis_lutea.AAC.1
MLVFNCSALDHRRGLIAKAVKSPTGLLLTTYDQLRLHREMLLPVMEKLQHKCLEAPLPLKMLPA